MNSSMIPTCLKRQARTRTRKTPLKPSPTRGSALHIIPELSEEDESSSSSPSSPLFSIPSSSFPVSVKARRRHAHLKLSDIRIAKDIIVCQDDHLMDQHHLSSPRPAPSPPSSPSDLLLNYASESSPCTTSRSRYSSEMHHRTSRPLLPTFSTPTLDSDDSSSSSVSPASQSTSLPTTPTSDNEFFASWTYARNSIRPLAIAKIRPSSHSHNDDPYDFDISVYESPELRQPYKNDQERHLHSDYDAISPIVPESDVSDSEEASDWYTRELSDILTLCSPLPKLSPISCPESTSSPVSPIAPSLPTRKSQRYSKPLPDLPRPSAQLDPSYPVRRRSIPTRPPPPIPVPVPALPSHLRSHRPPPRMSVPADFDFALPEDDSEFFASCASEFPSTSSFSFSSSSPSPKSGTPSSGSFYSQGSGDCEVEFDVDVQFELEMDQPMCLPLSLPSTPIDFEADITHAFEELRSRVDVPQPQRQPKPRPSNLQLTPATSVDLFASDEVTLGTGGRVLRSRWSSSTLSSAYSAQEDLGRSSMLSPSKLRFYFGGSKSKKASGNSRGRKSSVSSPPPTPMHAVSVTPRTPSSSRKHTRGASKESTSDIGHGYSHTRQSGGVRRSGSTSSFSVAGSDSGCSESSSNSSSGLRRKPIPVEMFLRST